MQDSVAIEGGPLPRRDSSLFPLSGIRPSDIICETAVANVTRRRGGDGSDLSPAWGIP